MTKLLAQKYNLPYLDLSRMTIDIDALKILAEEEARAGKMVRFSESRLKAPSGDRKPQSRDNSKSFKNLQEKSYKINTFMVSEESLIPRLETIQRSARV